MGIKQHFNRRTISLLLLTIIIALVVNGGIKILNVWLSPTASVLRNVVFAANILQVGLIVILILHLLSQASTQKFTQSTTLLVLAGGTYIVAGLLGNMLANTISPDIQLRGYENFVDENRFLVDAIKQFIEEEGRPPTTLAQLYPTYLAPPVATLQSEGTSDSDNQTLQLLVPYQSIDSASAKRVSYHYTMPDDLEANESPWELSVSIYLGSFQSVKFVFNEAQNYEEDYVKIDDWAYK